MVQQLVLFGTELRKRRLAADLTLTDLSKLVHYSKGQLSKVERGIKAPSRELARLCDTALNAGGKLAGLVNERLPREGPEETTGDDEVWLMQLSADGRSWFQPMSRRQALASGAASIAGMSIGGLTNPLAGKDGSLLGASRSLFDYYRQLGQTVAPNVLIPALIAQTHTLRELSSRADTRTRQGLLKLGSRYAEYVGWLVQETGNEQAALWWTQRAVDLAAAGGDYDLAAYALVRRALVTLYRADATQTVELAQRAQNDRVPPRIRGLAAQREAQGHALAGDYDACMRALDRARELLALAVPDSDTPVIGTTNLPDPVAMVSGWCLYDLGRPADAAEIMETQLSQVSSQAMRTQVRYGLRCALAHAAAGEVDHACDLAMRLLGSVTAVGSATITTDLRALARVLARHPRNRSVRDLAPELGTTLQIITP
ncbi:helix-turn-helix domain-containing protein [Microbispora sp. KK1-11]|uniref:helix-turn-helix domain-containing protein n=1 Tax=Microbispora sp. KK1-11 TaxID=2053005 RepID=UPI001159BFC9|nr:helix-turn-helix transcriptional regulator [Microbispora sp. KK1-11]TQS22491.1 helix-turn-helix transcriptional regulator [Microbispora sp. KK1-11]